MDAALTAKLRLDSSQFSGGLSRALRETSVSVGKMSAQFSSLRNTLTGGVAGAYVASFFGDIFAATMQVEKLKIALSATSGSTLLGESQFKQIRDMSADIGLEIEAAAKAMLQFQSAGMSSVQSVSAIKSGWNAILSTGGGAGEFSRLSVALQQLSNSPKVLQEEINQLREALPTTSKLMKEAFGTTRAEDIQKLNISGKEFVETLVMAMQKLPQMGNTMEKEIGRLRAKWQALMDDIGQSLKPGVSAGGGFLGGILDATRAARQFQFDIAEKLGGGDPKKRREMEAMAAQIMEVQKAAAASKAKALEDDAKDAASKDKSIAQGKTITGVVAKFDAILKEAAKSARELAAELDFGDRMKAFTDQQDARALEENLKNIKDATAESIKAKREAQSETLPFYGPKQMTPEEEGLRGQAQEEWRKKFAEAGMSRSERKSQREADREAEKNMTKAVNKEARDLLKKERDAARRDGFDNLKKNQFFQDEDAKKRIKDQVRKEADDAAKRSVITLGEIRDILKTLAVA